MPICTTCSVAITQLRPQDKAPAFNDINITLPRFRSWIVRNCWVCSKFSKWLEAEHPGLFNSWNIDELPVAYTLIGIEHIDRPQDPLISLLMLNITAQGLDPEDDACEVEVNLIPGEGIFDQINVVLFAVEKLTIGRF